MTSSAKQLPRFQQHGFSSLPHFSFGHALNNKLIWKRIDLVINSYIVMPTEAWPSHATKFYLSLPFCLNFVFRIWFVIIYTEGYKRRPFIKPCVCRLTMYVCNVLLAVRCMQLSICTARSCVPGFMKFINNVVIQFTVLKEKLSIPVAARSKA